ncbi:hypothetical protein F5Y15DRAFT_412574 [Xylariaceae sp. FL0016]|nr:hypothetical protein F5Y15DRAFT_412574 [Xylariaceae sp. FL0016]
MHFTSSLAAAFLAAATAHALPGASLEARQETPRIYAKFFSDSRCEGDWVEDTVWLQEPAGTCIDVNIPFAYNSTLISQNYATLTLRAYSVDGCQENEGNHFDVGAGSLGCYAQHIESVKFLQ